MEEENDRDRERNSKHLEYLSKERAKHIKGGRSPLRSFIVDYGTIKNQWPNWVDYMTLDLGETDQGSVFSANCDFGIL